MNSMNIDLTFEKKYCNIKNKKGELSYGNA